LRITCDIFRFDPDSGTKARYDTYALDAEPTDTVLDALIKIYRNADPSLSFRFACGVVKCGECAIMVNETRCLACKKLVEPEMKIDPLPDLPLIKDLVIDRRKAFEQMLKPLPGELGLLQLRERWQSIEPDTANRYVQLTKCFECLMCQSACPVFADVPEKFVGPLGLLWLAQMSLDPKKKAVVRQHAASALDMCTRCGICSGVCPCAEKILDLALDTLENCGACLT